MHTIRFEDLHFDDPTPSQLPGVHPRNRRQASPVVRIHRTARRRGTDLAWIPVTLFALACLAAVHAFTIDLVDQGEQQRRRGVARKPPAEQRTEMPPTAPRAKVGATPVKAAANKAANSPKTANHAGQQVAVSPPIPVPPQDTETPDVTPFVADALQACRAGRYKEAQTMATRAMHKTSSRTQGQAMWLLVEYFRQYDRLSREAIDRMNGAVVVDLGPDLGLGAFVDREGDRVTFQCGGKPERFTVEELCAREGVQFRITRKFLANGKKPANDLILAAVHLVRRIDADGRFDDEGERAGQEARKHLSLASASGDSKVAGDAALLVSLVAACTTMAP